MFIDLLTIVLVFQSLILDSSESTVFQGVEFKNRGEMSISVYMYMYVLVVIKVH